jgi:hypothetical protein
MMRRKNNMSENKDCVEVITTYYKVTYDNHTYYVWHDVARGMTFIRDKSQVRTEGTRGYEREREIVYNNDGSLTVKRSRDDAGFTWEFLGGEGPLEASKAIRVINIFFGDEPLTVSINEWKELFHRENT